jgi:hypothetical protein
MAKPDKEIIKIFSKSAGPSETRKIGNMMLNLTDRNSEKTSSELYIQRLGTKALMKKIATEG